MQTTTCSLDWKKEDSKPNFPWFCITRVYYAEGKIERLIFRLLSFVRHICPRKCSHFIHNSLEEGKSSHHFTNFFMRLFGARQNMTSIAFKWHFGCWVFFILKGTHSVFTCEGINLMGKKEWYSYIYVAPGINTNTLLVICLAEFKCGMCLNAPLLGRLLQIWISSSI